MRGQFRILVEHALDHGEAHLLADQSAIAIWMHHDQTPAPEPYDYDQRLAEACGQHTQRFRILDQLLHDHHPAEPAHHHLAFLAVLPPWQATGRGSALLAHHQQHLDTTETPAYLEASSPRSRDLYTRFGYRTAGQPFRLPDGPAFWPMWRQPHPAATDAPGHPLTATGSDPATH
ncbi:MAG: GNAT family N-acetyltransferase [Micromonosporaceae bacterium]|nr:GNAT family N-acetyltransferase [Micromonosporaceae bacterium]